MGRLGALLRPTCTSYAGCAQWDYGYFLINHMTQQDIVEQSSPLGEKVVRSTKRGAFPAPVRAVLWFL